MYYMDILISAAYEEIKDIHFMKKLIFILNLRKYIDI